MRWYILFLGIFVLLTVVLIWNIPASSFSETIPVMVNISDTDHIDVHVTKEPQKMFNFGTTFAGTKIEKTMNLTRGQEPPAKVHISASGEIRDWIVINKNDFVLNEPTQIKVTIAIPDTAKKDTYNGNITIDYVNTYGLRAMEALYGLIR